MQRTRARRRSQAEVKAEILAAATALFAERGYANTTTRAIARQARASEVLLYKYFHSKAELFERAVAMRFEEMMAEARLIIQRRPREERVDYSKDFVKVLYRMMHADKGLLMALITARAFDANPADTAEKSAALTQFFEGAQGRVAQSREEIGFESGLAAPIASRLAFATVLASAVLGDWLFDALSNETEIIEGIADFVARGLYGVPFSPGETQ